MKQIGIAISVLSIILCAQFLFAQSNWEYEDSFIQHSEAMTASVEGNFDEEMRKFMAENENAGREVLWSEITITELVPASSHVLNMPCKNCEQCIPPDPQPGHIYDCVNGYCVDLIEQTTTTRTRTRTR